MNIFIDKLLCFMVGFLFACPLLAIEVPLDYVKYPDKPETYLPAGMARLTYELDPPPGSWKFPDFVSAHPIYSLVKLGDEELLLVLDRQKTEDERYNRIFFDANGNRNLTDDPIIDGRDETVPNTRSKRVRFPSVDTKIKIQGKYLPFSFRPDFLGQLFAVDEGNISEELMNKMIYLFLRVNCMYRGMFELEGQTYHVFLGDADCNGIFNKKFALRKQGTPLPGRLPIMNTGDNFFISRNEEIDVYDGQVYGDWLLIKNKLFKVNMDQPNATLSLTPVTAGLASLRLAMKPEHISLYTDGGGHFLMTYLPDKKIDVPKARYRLYNYKLVSNDDQGDLWSLSARATTESRWIDVTGSTDSELIFGEPFIISAEVPKNRIVAIRGSPTESGVFLSFSIRGQGDEDIQDIRHLEGDRTKIPLSKIKGLTHRPKEPTFKILSAGGKIAAQGSFEYG